MKWLHRGKRHAARVDGEPGHRGLAGHPPPYDPPARALHPRHRSEGGAAPARGRAEYAGPETLHRGREGHACPTVFALGGAAPSNTVRTQTCARGWRALPPTPCFRSTRLAGSTGLEPATSGLTVQCANQAAPRAPMRTRICTTARQACPRLLSSPHPPSAPRGPAAAHSSDAVQAR